ncbi:MAG TPA: heparan-alpha-glucosaminide N-acetyltransferase domain-containing protein, partial [Cyclobacteriaceae bacterium]|nr:heparan-alpha-glucosaminide N-acetyltransferase domain-containing protein [Cyclobacteriaceae bacterium]
IGANVDDPLNLATTTPLLFFTRWITHFCAPVFIFLSGTSIYLQSQRKTKKELGVFLLKRGLWLVVLECCVVSLGWTFNLQYNIIPLQVIWAIGISMFLFGVLMLANIPYKVIFVLGIILVAGHNILDFPEATPGFQPNFWWDLFHHGVFVPYQYAPGHFALLVYPFPAWMGVMLLGYCTGKLFTVDYTTEQRKKILTRTGLGLLTLFIVVRLTNVYGDPVNWSAQPNGFYTVLSFINVTKYPPSLLFLCLMLGPALVLLAFIENLKNRLSETFAVFGRTALFYYILHIYVIHIAATICFFARGHSFEDAVNVGEQFPFMFVAPGEGYGLEIVYLVWILVVMGLYPLCKVYDRYKTI